jgi:murein DD-endopeptidase MepM/ murein hydrolase activator NlpD
VQNAIDAETSNTIGNIQKELVGLAGGGSVPRTLSTGQSIGMQIGERLGKTLEAMMNSKVTETLQSIRQQFGKEGFGLGPDGGPGGGPGGDPLTQDQQEAFEKIKKIAERLGSPNPSVTAAIAMHESGYLKSVLARQNNNPFGQTDGRGGFQIYRSLDEAVEYHINRWKSSYIGNTPQEIIESIRLGKGKGAPGAYNVEDPNWAQKVLRAYQSGTQPQPSATPTKGAWAAVLPRGNPILNDRFGYSSWRGRMHEGIDLGVDANSPVTALADGKVVAIYENFGTHGDAVLVQHADGNVMVYGHVNRKVKEGDTVKKGQTIATVKYWPKRGTDNTHLHLERRIGSSTGTAIDPINYLNSLVPKPVKPPKKSTPSPPPQTRTQMLGGRSWTQHPITKNWTDQFGNRYSNGDFQNRLIQERKGTQASLAPSTSPSIASGLDQELYTGNSPTLVAIQRIHIHHNNTLPSMSSGGPIDNSGTTLPITAFL